MNSRAAVLEGPGGPLSVESLELSTLPSHCVLVRMAASGICGTDLHVLQGTMESKFGFPVILGHEAAGVVQEVGNLVKGVSTGDRVLVTAITPCLSCERCLSGLPYLCDRSWDIVLRAPMRRQSGQAIQAFFGIGSLSEFVIAPATAAIHLPHDIKWEIGALLACGGQTGLGSVFNTAQVTSGSRVAVFGCGTVGLCVVMASRVAGAGEIIAFDTNPDRLRLAAELGATSLANPLEEDPTRKVLAGTGEGCDYAFECVGKVEVMEQAFGALRPGGTLVIIGAPPRGSGLRIDPRELLLDRKVVGSFAGSVRPHHDYPRWFALYRRGVLPLDRLLTKSYDLDSANDAFSEMASGKVLKPIVGFKT